MRHKKQKKALLITLVFFVFLMIPVSYLWWLNMTAPNQKIPNLGPIPSFAYSANNGTTAVTHFDCFKRVSVFLNLPLTLDNESTKECLDSLYEIKKWSNKTLQNPNPADSKPQSIMFVVFNKGATFIDQTARDLRVVSLESDQEFVLPKNTNPLDWCSLSLVNQEAEFAGVFDLQDQNWKIQVKNLMQRLTADTNLLHYLTLQSLMWQKAKDYARGKSVE